MPFSFFSSAYLRLCSPISVLPSSTNAFQNSLPLPVLALSALRVFFCTIKPPDVWSTLASSPVYQRLILFWVHYHLFCLDVQPISVQSQLSIISKHQDNYKMDTVHYFTVSFIGRFLFRAHKLSLRRQWIDLVTVCSYVVPFSCILVVSAVSSTVMEMRMYL
jgi:hypothetical protein